VKPDGTEASEEPTLVLNLLNEPQAIQESRHAVAAFLQPLGVVAESMNRVEVVLEELLSNLVRHGKDVSSIMIAAGYRRGSVDLVVEDDGATFDPLAKPEPDPFTTLAEAPLGGLGIPLVRRLTSAADYERVGTGPSARNRVSVTIANRE
jgi:serine/threonine-protein kinase RsbW